MATTRSVKRERGIRLLRFGLTGAIAASLIFIGLWTASQLPIGPSDLIMELFASRTGPTTAGLGEGAIYAALIGFFAGALIDLVYEGLHWLERR